MRQFNIRKGLVGFTTLENYMIRYRHMIKDEAKRKEKILTFWSKHGLQPTIDAYGVSRPALYLWKQKLKQDKGKLESLNNKSRRPSTVRKRRIPTEIETFIISQRREHPRFGKEKLSELLKDFCKRNNIVNIYSSSTVGRILKDLKDRDMLPTYTKVSLSTLY
jgi:transposase-like protein